MSIKMICHIAFFPLFLYKSSQTEYTSFQTKQKIISVQIFANAIVNGTKDSSLQLDKLDTSGTSILGPDMSEFTKLFET